MSAVWYIGGSRHQDNDRGDALSFYTDDILLCQRHARGMPLQPFTSFDKERGFGKLGCPFCMNGVLAGRFSQLRSRKAIAQALDKLALKLLRPRAGHSQIPPRPLDAVEHATPNRVSG